MTDYTKNHIKSLRNMIRKNINIARQAKKSGEKSLYSNAIGMITSYRSHLHLATIYHKGKFVKSRFSFL